MHGPCSPVARTVLPAVFFGYKQRVYPGYHVENRVSPHSDAGSRKGDVKGMYFASAPAGISGFRIKCGMTKTGIPRFRIGVRDDQMSASGYGMTGWPHRGR